MDNTDPDNWIEQVNMAEEITPITDILDWVAWYESTIRRANLRPNPKGWEATN